MAFPVSKDLVSQNSLPRPQGGGAPRHSFCLTRALSLLVVGPSLVAYGGVIGSQVGLSVFQVCRCLRPLGQGAFQARLVAVAYFLVIRPLPRGPLRVSHYLTVTLALKPRFSQVFLDTYREHLYCAAQ